MEPTADLYIKLSRVRDDYGIAGRQGTKLFISELEGFTSEQLRTLKVALMDECGDLEYQIGHEMKRHELDARWMYGCKNSFKAREKFINKISEILDDTIPETEIALRFMREAKRTMDHKSFDSLLAIAKGENDPERDTEHTGVFKVSDLA